MNQSFEILSSKFFDDGKPLHPRFNKFRKTIKEIDTFLRQKIPSTRNSHKKCPLCGGIYAVVIANKSSEGLPVNRQVCKTCGLFYSAEYLLPEFVEESKTGFVMDNLSAKVLSEKIIGYYNLDDKSRSSMSDSAYEYSQNKCSWDLVSKSKYNFYKEVLSNV